MTNETQKPKLVFFQTTPDKLLSSPPLASSLQSLESSFFMIALGRYPHALVSCAAAIESAIKAAFRKSPKDRDRLKELLARARTTSKSLGEFPEAHLDHFRDVRNRVVHYGFSPKDDDETARLLLKVGFRFLDRCYSEFFHFSSKEGLFPDFYRQLAIAMEVYDKAETAEGINLTYCFRAFGHLVRWSTKEPLMSHWELDSTRVADETGQKFNSVEKQRLELEHIFGSSWSFDCPICRDMGTFVCELDEDQLTLGEVTLHRAECANCGLIIPHGCMFLADVLCREQVAKRSSAILEDFGLTA